ncbi:MAG: ATP-binding protein [bacterium]
MKIKRKAETILHKFVKGYPVIAITGPRQSGKTTLAKMVFPNKPYVSLEDLDIRSFAIEDPRGFLAQYPKGAILDEVQRVPELFSYLQSIVDKEAKMGMFILTGSQHFGLLSAITQTLAGRVAMLQLLPFSMQELKSSQSMPVSIEELMFKGFYPPLYDRDLEASIWLENYIQTYLERDVYQLIKVQDMLNFQKFIRLLASYTGQLLNLSNIANDCGISHNTVKAWLSVLEASYIIHLLRPHHKNFNKRMIKSPKLYFYDTGLATRLLGIQNSNQLTNSIHRGALFETLIVSDFIKQSFNKGLGSNLYFWRDQTGNEVDLLLDYGDHIEPVEIKSSQTINTDFFKGLKRWLELAKQEHNSKDKIKKETSMLIYAGEETYTRSGVKILSWRDL